LFTSGDYRVYNFTASYSYPSGESSSVAVAITYQLSAGYESDFINQWLFDDPYVGSDVASYVTEDDAGTIRYTSTKDIIADDGDFTQSTTAQKPIQATSSFQKKGMQFEINIYNALSKIYTGNEAWFLSEHSIVFNMIGPNFFSAGFECTIMQAGFNDRPLQVQASGAGYKVGNKSTYAPEVLTKGVPQTVIAGRDSSGNYRLVSSEGADLTVGGFAGWSTVDMFLGFFVPDTSKQCDIILHEFGTNNFFPDTSKQTEIYARSILRWFELPPSEGNTITSDGLTSKTQDGLTVTTPVVNY
jgi:hypothetical protein